MSVATRAPISPAVLRWARESSGLTVEQAAERLRLRPERLQAAGRKSIQTSGSLSTRRDRPHGPTGGRSQSYSCQVHPKKNVPLFSSGVRDAPPWPWPPAMIRLARRIQQIQDDAAELMGLLGETPQWRSLSGVVSDSPNIDRSAAIRDELALTVEDQKVAARSDRNGYRVFRVWREAIEALGILVLQDGTLTVKTVRGFSVEHARAPAIVLNTREDIRARTFTLVHELLHILDRALTEEECDSLAGDTLFPRIDAQHDFAASPHDDLVASVDWLAWLYGLTPYAIAVRLRRYEFVSQIDIDHAIAVIRSRSHDVKQQQGGDYYGTQISRLGRGFLGRAVTALETGLITPLETARITGVRVDNLTTLRGAVEGSNE